MRREFMLGIMIVLAVALITIPVSALNPHSTDNPTGQPSQSCQDVFGEAGPFLLPGFNTYGFNFVAVFMYAGSGHTANGNNPNAVSQYDVACFQQGNH